MGRKKKFTHDYYEDAAQAAVNRLRKDGCSKDEILILAGFESEDGEPQRQHWSRLRKAFSRIGVTLCYVDGKGWKKGTVGENGNVVEMYHRQIDRLVKSVRPEVIAHLQNAQTAHLAVAHLANEKLDPLTFLTACQHVGQPLPEDAERQLLTATMEMLPEMPLELRTRIERLEAGLTRIVALLPAPS